MIRDSSRPCEKLVYGPASASDILQQGLPALDGNRSVEIVLECPSGARAHLAAVRAVGGQHLNGSCQRRAVARSNDVPARMLPHEAGDLAVLIADEDGRPSRRANAVELARDDQAFELWSQADEMHVRGR